MALTQADLKAIQGVIQSTVAPMIDDAVEDLAQRTAAGFAEVHEKLAEHDHRFEQIDRRFEQIDERFERIEDRLDRIETKLDATVERVDDHGARLRRLEPKAA